MGKAYNIISGKLSNIDKLKYKVKVLESIIRDIAPIGHFITAADDNLRIVVKRSGSGYNIPASSMLPHLREALRQTKKELELREKELDDLMKNRTLAGGQNPPMWQTLWSSLLGRKGDRG